MNTYSDHQMTLVQNLINTYDLYLVQPEHLQTPNDLARFLTRNGIPVKDVTEADLEAVRSLREHLRAGWNADHLAGALNILNPLLGQTPLQLEAQTADDQTVHLKLTPPEDSPLVQRVAVECALGIIAVLQHYGLDRMQACAAAPCQDVFIDTSRNKSKRFCSEQCANRYNIAAYRERHKNKP